MYANYHTHTPRCHHASGSERDYINTAIKANIRILGFSDHTPYDFYDDPDYISGIRMGMDELPDYVSTLLSLKEEYADRIELHIGLEAEYYPKYFPRLLSRLQDFPVEYLLLGQHCEGNEIGGCYYGAPTSDVHVLKSYVRQCMEAMDTGRFAYLAHPDLICFLGENDIYDSQMRILCRKAKECSLPLEINLLGIRDGRNYPKERFWAIAGEEGCDVIFGADAHTPESLSSPDSDEYALGLVKKYSLRLLDELPSSHFRRLKQE